MTEYPSSFTTLASERADTVEELYSAILTIVTVLRNNGVENNDIDIYTPLVIELIRDDNEGEPYYFLEIKPAK